MGKIHKCSTRNIIIITCVVATVTVTVTLPSVILLSVPLPFPICWGANHRRHRHLLRWTGSAAEAPEGCCREFSVAFVVVVGSVLVSGMCGFTGGGERRQERGDGGFAVRGLDYGRDLSDWIIGFWNGVPKLVSWSSPFHVFCHNRHGLDLRERICVEKLTREWDEWTIIRNWSWKQRN